ncbi:hypothetical protein [Microbulbifer sp. TRSA005]|uniref:hypothetical protein n=1 Tax=unclassified Microbulbifer TaxID=2619833 RepID=UPI004039066B
MGNRLFPARAPRHRTSQPPGGHALYITGANTLNFIPAERYNLGQTLTFRATSIGSGKETTTSGTFIGASHTEPAPANLNAHRANGQLVIQWLGVGRLGGRAAYDQSQFFAGYRVTVNGQSTDTTATTLSIADPGTATIKVSQLNSITGPGLMTQIGI